MRGVDHVLIRRPRNGERRIAERKQTYRERDAERIRELHVLNGRPFIGNRVMFGRIRSGMNLLHSRRMRLYRAFARLLYRDFPDRSAKLAFFSHPRTVHVRLRRGIFVGRCGLPGKLRDSRGRRLLRVVVRGIAALNLVPWRNGKPYGHEFVRKRSE